MKMAIERIEGSVQREIRKLQRNMRKAAGVLRPHVLGAALLLCHRRRHFMICERILCDGISCFTDRLQLFANRGEIKKLEQGLGLRMSNFKWNWSGVKMK
jgi:hypothetical protein